MTKEQVVGFLNAVNAAYPQFSVRLSEAEKKAQVTIWYSMLAKDDAKIVWQAFQEHVATSKYPPVPADIRRGIRSRTMTSPDELFERFKVIGYKSIHPEVIEEGTGRETRYITKHYSREDFAKEPAEIREYVRTLANLKTLYYAYRDDPAKVYRDFVAGVEKIQMAMDVSPITGGENDRRYLSETGRVGALAE